MVVAGACLAAEPPTADDLLGFLAEGPLKWSDPDDGREAVRLTAELLATVRQRLENGNPLLDLAATPGAEQQYALALGNALLGLADGIDTAGLDPDAFEGEAAERFEHLGRRSAASLELADMLEEGEVMEELGGELDDLRSATEADVRALYRALRELAH